MGNYLYELFRSASGFSLVIAGITCFVAPKRERIHLAFGIVYTVSGLLFIYSAIDPVIKTGMYAGIVILAILFYFLGQGLFEIGFFLLGDKMDERHCRKTYHVGFGWTLILCILPLFDRLFSLGPARESIEDATVMPPFHYAAYILAYLWPVVSTAWALIGGYIRLPDQGTTYRASKRLLVLISLLLGSTLVGIAGFAVSIPILYRAGNTLLQAFIIAFYIYNVAHPELFTRVKEEIQEARTKKKLLDKREEVHIRDELGRLAKSGDFLFESSLTLSRLAARLGVSAHQLSYYFNTCVGTGFSAWHNKTKIERAKILLAEDGDASIIEIAFNCGFGSKTVFNEQFKRLVGTTPTEFRVSKKKEPSRKG